MADSCCCAGRTTVSSQRRTAQLTALAASATRWRFSAMLRSTGRSPRYRPVSAPDGRPDTRRPIYRLHDPVSGADLQRIRRPGRSHGAMTLLDRSRRSGALWHALVTLDDDPSVRPDAHVFIEQGAVVH